MPSDAHSFAAAVALVAMLLTAGSAAGQQDAGMGSGSSSKPLIDPWTGKRVGPTPAPPQNEPAPRQERGPAPTPRPDPDQAAKPTTTPPPRAKPKQGSKPKHAPQPKRTPSPAPTPAPPPAQPEPIPPAPRRAAPSPEDEAVMRDLELLMLMEMLKDYELFYEDP